VVANDDNQAIAGGPMVCRIFAANAADGLFERQTIFDLDEVARRSRQGDDDVGEGAERGELNLARDIDLVRVNAVVGRVPKSAQLAAQFFQKQPHLAVEHRIHFPSPTFECLYAALSHSRNIAPHRLGPESWVCGGCRAPTQVSN
jgi:hypothetical protein